ncbi:MAG: Mrp/NBP35 family ATP-binding protein [Syntrophomonadaceae bacterium]|jgi:Mrp family chromosome partitioning ATPase
MSDNCKTCPSAAGCSSDPGSCGVETEPNTLVGAFNNIRNVITVMSGKGGVGKSSVTALLAISLAKQGKRVGILDADITGPSQPKAFGINGSIKAGDYGMLPPVSQVGIKLMSINFFLPNEDDPVIWRGPMLAGAVKQFWSDVDWRDLDYLIVDLPPGTGDIPLTVMQSLPVNGIVIVSSPQDLAFMVVKKTIKMAQKLQLPILGLVENMSHAICPHCHEKIEIFGKSQGAKVAQEAGVEFLGGLSWDDRLNALLDEGKIEEYQSSEMESIAARVMEQLP